MLLSLKKLQKNYPGFSLDVSMEIEEGQITGLIGANGAGKSTTFKVILGLVHSDAGEIRLFNKDMEQISPKEKADIGATLSDSGFSNQLRHSVRWYTGSRSFRPQHITCQNLSRLNCSCGNNTSKCPFTDRTFRFMDNLFSTERTFYLVNTIHQLVKVTEID